ncbi:MAG: hypothetical protein V1776_04625 [Candidatus Diapherotrites archaeon]
MDPLTDVLFNLISLAWVSFQLFVPMLIITVILLFVFNQVQKKTRWKWIGSTILTLFLSFFLFLFVIHSLNIWNGLNATDDSTIPPDLRENPLFEQGRPTPITLEIQAFINSIIGGILLTLLILPFAFIGISIFDVLKKRFHGVWTRLVITVFLGAIGFILLLAFFPWIPVSLIYLVFYGA